MLKIQNLLKPDSIDEALKILNENNKARILGGGAFLRLSNDLTISKAIDLYGLGLNEIREKENEFHIGSMTTIRDLETDENLNKYFSNTLSKSVENIVGVQLRNIATVGGTVCGKYGFSDLITSLLVLNTTLEFQGRDNISLEMFLRENNTEKDILKSIVINKDNSKASFKMIRNSRSDFAILNVAVSSNDGYFKIAVGARPRVARLSYKAMAYINTSDEISEDVIETASEIAMNELAFGNNRFASSDYRRDMCKVLIRRAFMEVLNDN